MPPENRRARATGGSAGSEKVDGTYRQATRWPRQTVDPLYMWNFQRRVLQDALNEASAAYWLRRSRDFEPGSEVYTACRNKARFIAMYGAGHAQDVENILREQYGAPYPWELAA